MSWHQIDIDVQAGEIETLTDRLEALGAVAVTLRPADGAPVWEPGPGAAPLPAAGTLSALFPAGADLDRIQTELLHHLGTGSGGRLRTAVLEDQDWSRTWREHFQPMYFGTRLWIGAREDPAPPPPVCSVHIDPGLAFGTGTHPTTALCLEWLSRAALDGKTVLDFGCGSGILALAALALGAARAYGVDHDPQARAAARDNAAYNDLAGRLWVGEPETLPIETVDIVIANILAGPLQALAGTLLARLRPGGRLVLSGILLDQTAPLIQTYRRGAHLVAEHERDGWVLLEMERPGDGHR